MRMLIKKQRVVEKYVNSLFLTVLIPYDHIYKYSFISLMKYKFIFISEC